VEPLAAHPLNYLESSPPETTMDYDPLIHPLELPVQRLTLHCISAAPLHFLPRPGSTPGTTFYGIHTVFDSLINVHTFRACPVVH
jgi:hypothetical protein